MDRRNVASSCLLRVKNMSLSEAMAAVVRALRQNRKMTQDDLTMIGRRGRSRIEGGKANVTIDTLSNVASMLEVDPALLLLLAHSAHSGEPVDVALKRISSKLNALKQDGVIENIAAQPERPIGRPATRDIQKALQRAPLLKEAGMSNAEIAQELGVSKTTVQRYLTKPLS
ncbi:transcriptional regulator [Pseudomonas sp. B21-031]|jgi:transcriptional regulator with XRE-family HTH domain|uniref:transcriptional regulator n=1 Tax=Pseudomonas sp. B21-031 TaxID=2895482 RepID=UPI00215DD942|nr:transcriptional regulator [Pseudomonas sp. B21-031]UVL65165.1 transcriptional regulator [Pseudomonas sp. B21-031]